MENGQVYSALGQPGIGFFMAIVIGALAGWIAERFTRSDMGLFANILLGIIGAVVGNYLATLLSIDVYGFWRNFHIGDGRRDCGHHDLPRRDWKQAQLLRARRDARAFARAPKSAYL